MPGLISGTRFFCAQCLRHSIVGRQSQVDTVRRIAMAGQGVPSITIPRAGCTTAQPQLVEQCSVRVQTRTLSTRKSSAAGSNKNSARGTASSNMSSRQKGSGREKPPVPTPSTPSSKSSRAIVPPKGGKNAQNGSPAATTLAVSPTVQINHKNINLPDYRHTYAPPGQELDALQSFVDKLLLTNSTIAKRALLAQNPEQAPILAWIYDPLRQFNVKSTSILKYALLRARQRDEAPRSSGTKLRSRSGLGAGAVAGETPINNGSNITNTDSITVVVDHPEISDKQRADGIARALTLGPGYETLPALLSALSTKAISGYTALDAVLLFMERFCNVSSQGIVLSTKERNYSSGYQDVTLQLFGTPRSKLLLKILDKNLKTGCNVAMIRDTYPSLMPGFYVSLGHSLLSTDEARPLFPESGPGDPSTVGKNKRGTDEATLPRTGTTRAERAGQHVVGGWFASRKLDGVRCLVRLDRFTGGIEVLSRKGRAFENARPIQEAMRQLLNRSLDHEKEGASAAGVDKPVYHSWDGFFRRALGSDRCAEKELPEAIIFDGEACIFVAEPSNESESKANKIEEKIGGVITVGEDEPLGRESFLKASSFLRRAAIDQVPSYATRDAQELGSDYDVDSSNEVHFLDAKNDRKINAGFRSGLFLPGYDTPIYYIFDCLTDEEFKSRRGTRLFSKRIQAVSNALAQDDGEGGVGTLAAKSYGPVMLIKVLKQTKVESFQHLKKLVAQGLEHGWEGIILRRDAGYEGKRSRNLLKIKQFQDAEFVVQDVMLGSMRIAHQGHFEERDNLLTNVVILHRGNRVRVGSGFSVEDRIRFGKDPSLIVGKTITVQYFEESKTYAPGGFQSFVPVAELSQPGDKNKSTAVDDDGAVWSLRFPTVKAIYEKGHRDI